MSKKGLIILVCIILFGCAGITDRYISQPVSTGINYKFWPNNGTVVFNLEGIKLYMKPQNSIDAAYGGMLLLPIPIVGPKKEIVNNYVKSTYLFKENAYSAADVVEGDYFYIEVLLKTKRDGFFFNPGEVYLELDNSKLIKANKYLMPAMEFARPHNFWSFLIHTNRSFFEWRTESKEQTVGEYFKISPNKYIGFAVRFNVPTPNPGIPFNIEIKGLKYFENTVFIPKIKYKDKKIVREYIIN